MQSGIGAQVRIVLVAIFLAAPGAVARGKDKKKDPEQIGNRDVGKGVNLYSFEKEIALGKQMAQEVEREAKIIGDPIISEYVNRVGQNLVRNSDAKVPIIRNNALVPRPGSSTTRLPCRRRSGDRKRVV